MHKELISHLADKFHVVTVISNPVRYNARWNLYNNFQTHMGQHNANLLTVETTFGHRNHAVTKQDHVSHLQLQSKDEIWHKENMINLGIQRLPKDWKYVAWIDADIEFMRKDWIEETIHQLQHYQVVQMFQTAVDLGPNGEALQTHNGFMWSYLSGKPYNKKYYPSWHPGYCWAARREAIDGVGGLLDKAILGAGDHHMAQALIGRATNSLPPGISKDYRDMVLLWQERAEKYIRRNVGFVPGTISHHWHGKKKDRKYVDRWQILVKHKYSPFRDLKVDWQGLYQLADHGDPRSVELRDAIRAYFRVRNEDSIDLV